MSEELDIKKYFPLDTPRGSQVGVLQAIHNTFRDFNVIILEGPVGSGKSAIAETLARAYGDAHILTPRKSLQDQYMEDFQKFGLVTMKGKGSYPCISNLGGGDKSIEYERVLRILDTAVSDFSDIIADKPYREGQVYSVPKGDCVSGGKKDTAKFKMCQMETKDIDGNTIINRPCPFTHAINVATDSKQVVHNLHSFLFQNYYGQYFTKRKLLVIDEAHELEGIVRDFISKSFTLPMLVENIPANGPEVPDPDDPMSSWIAFLSWEGFVPNKRTHEEKHNEWVESLEFLDSVKDTFLKNKVVFTEDDPIKRKSKVRFVPENMGKAPADLFLQYGMKVLLMSGTVYSKQYISTKLGLAPEEVAFIRLNSEFPIKTRPIIADKRLMTNNSHASWTNDRVAYGRMIENISSIMNTHIGVKGLLHAPSYTVAHALCERLGERMVTHDQDNFQEKLAEFYASDKPLVFVSPICQQGVDFKYDRARFQMIVRVPYLNTSDPFVERMMKKNYSWYNYQALVIFGQMTGRVNRAPDDYGITYLLDSRFPKFIRSNAQLLPKWLLGAIEFK